MAVSAYQKGRMLLVSADKPPATGCILFESVDAGRTWVNISDDVADAAAVLTEHAPEVFDQAPLTMFVPGEPRHVDYVVVGWTLKLSLSGKEWRKLCC